MPDETTPKPIFESKTAIVNAIIALAPLYPPARDWVSANPAETLAIIGVVNLLLRWITKQRVVLY